MTKQAKYKATPRGKQKQTESVQRYRARTESWQTILDKNYSDILKEGLPDGMSKSEFLKRLLDGYALTLLENLRDPAQ